MQIWKYELKAHMNPRIVIKMPKGAQVLHASAQDGMPQLWAIVNADADLEERVFKIVYSGIDFDPRGWAYCKSVQAGGGGIVLHIFELAPAPWSE